MKKILFALSFALLLASSAWAGTPSVSAEAQAVPSRITVGDEIKLYIVIERPKNYSLIQPTAKTELAPFEIKGLRPGPLLPGKNRVREAYVFTLTIFEIGDFQIPAIPVRFRSPSGEEGQIWTSPVSIKVVSIGKKPGDKDDIRPIKGPFSFDLAWLRVWGIALSALVLVLVLAGILLWRRLKNRIDPETLKAPHERVRLELKRLEQKAYLPSGLAKEHYSELTDIFRRYLERRFSIIALEKTSGEILSELKGREFERSLVDKAGDVLNNADLVKFAKLIPERDLAGRLESEILEFVDATKMSETQKP